jgi:hypothetical protein
MLTSRRTEFVRPYHLSSAQPRAQWQHFEVGGCCQPSLCPFPLGSPAPLPSLPVLPEPVLPEPVLPEPV